MQFENNLSRRSNSQLKDCPRLQRVLLTLKSLNLTCRFHKFVLCKIESNRERKESRRANRWSWSPMYIYNTKAATNALPVFASTIQETLLKGVHSSFGRLQEGTNAILARLYCAKHQGCGQLPLPLKQVRLYNSGNLKYNIRPTVPCRS